MASTWTSKTWIFREVGYAARMTELAENDEILRDVIRGDNGEGTDWTGHAHRDDDTWNATNGDIGEPTEKATKVMRGVVLREEVDVDLDQNSNDGGVQAPFGVWAETTAPLGNIRRDYDTNTGTDMGVGHEDETYGFWMKWESYDIGTGTYAWKRTIYNEYNGGTQNDRLFGQSISPGA